MGGREGLGGMGEEPEHELLTAENPEHDGFAKMVDGKVVYHDPPMLILGGGSLLSPNGLGAAVISMTWLQPAGDGRDRFRYWHRKHLHEQIWAHYNHQDAPDTTFLLLLFNSSGGSGNPADPGGEPSSARATPERYRPSSDRAAATTPDASGTTGDTRVAAPAATPDT